MKRSSIQSIVALVAAMGVIATFVCFASSAFNNKNEGHLRQPEQRRRLSTVSDPKTIQYKGGPFSRAAPFYIIQASPPRSGSTLMANLLSGFFDPPQNDICFLPSDFMEQDPTNPNSCLAVNHVLKTHVPYAKQLTEWLLKTGVPNIFFISTNRAGVTLAGDEFCAQHNVICFEYMNFVYSNEIEMEDVVHRVAKRIRSEFPGLAELLNEQGGFQRLKEMEEMTQIMSDKPFSMVNSKYSIHGGHRANWGQS